MHSKKTAVLPCITDAGLLTTLTSDKLRWWPRDLNRHSRVSSIGNRITSCYVSKDNEWIVFARHANGVWALKLSGGSRDEFQLPSGDIHLGSRIYALHVYKKSENEHVVLAGDSHGLVVSWNLRGETQNVAPRAITGSKNSFGKITAITCYNNEIYLAIKGGTTVVKIDQTSGYILEKWPLCSTPPVYRLIVADHLQKLIAGSQHRQLTVYSLQDDKDVQFLSGDTILHSFEVSPKSRDYAYQCVLGVSDFEVFIWRILTDFKKGKPLQPHGRIIFDPASNPGCTILQAKFLSDDPSTILIAYGLPLRPFFNLVKYIDESGNIIASQTIVGAQPSLPVDEQLSSVHVQAADQASSAYEDVKLIGPLDIQAVQAVTDLDVDMSVDGVEESIPDSKNLPFEQLIHQLDTKATPDTQQPRDIIPSTSACAALVGALSANDKVQLSSILSSRDEEFIKNTLRQLPVSHVVPLLSELLFSFSKKPAFNLISWMQNLLIIHRSYLVSAPDILEKLGGLYNAIDERLQHFPELLKLSGRFDLLMTHIDTNGRLHSKSAIRTYTEDGDDHDVFDLSNECDSDAESNEICEYKEQSDDESEFSSEMSAECDE